MKAKPWQWVAVLALIVASDLAGTAAEPAITAAIDRQLAQRWAEAGVHPAPAASDAEFLRRVTLDLTGTVPTVAEVRAFLEDKSPGKRAALVDRLLDRPRYVTHFTNVWRAILLPENANVDNFGLRFTFEAWLRDRLGRNVGYDQMVREILTSGPSARNLRGEGGIEGGASGPAAFAAANENKPENLAGSTARLFLAVKLECAQCHNHPHADWTQEQFWQYAAFFGGSVQGGERVIPIPKVAKTVPARFPDGATPKWRPGVNPRVTLADWTVSPDNPYFSRATVNRVWAHFFGNGLVEPVEDLTQDAGRDALLSELAKQFAQQRFDLKVLIRGIVLSRAYQLSSSDTEEHSDKVRLFARMSVRGLSPEQIFDSLVVATGHRDAGEVNTLGLTPRAEFLVRFPRQNENPTEAQTSILQALALMNGTVVDAATTLERSETLAAVANAPFLSTADRVETLYLAAYGRPPRPEERDRMVRYVDRGGPSGDSNLALADVFWALLNSGEFFLNH